MADKLLFQCHRNVWGHFLLQLSKSPVNEDFESGFSCIYFATTSDARDLRGVTASYINNDVRIDLHLFLSTKVFVRVASLVQKLKAKSFMS